ncbi:hypothetical protein ID855_20825 [Xenorhabdus sp. ZM]|nr:hypothetical protein [Xenorhabdus sp. ZM]
MESLLKRIQNNIFNVLPYRYLGLTEIQRAIGMGELFDSYYIFQNYPNTTQILSDSSELQISERINGAFGVSHYPLGVTVIPNDKIELLIGYDPNFFDIVNINKIKENLLEILSKLGKE